MPSRLITRLATLVLSLTSAAASAQVEIKLTPTSGALGGASFGTSISVAGSTAVIGAVTDDDNGFFSGSAYLFDTSTGSPIMKLLAIDGAAGDFFGDSVGISGNTIIVGAPGKDDLGADSGAAYLFDATTGLQTMKLLPVGGTASQGFGKSVAISGSAALVGSPGWGTNNSGRAFLFDTATGALIGTITSPAPGSAALFGSQVALRGTTVLVASAGDDEMGFDAGAAYLLDISGGAPGVVIEKLLPTGPGEQFGHTSLDLSGSQAIVGAPGAADNGASSGVAYIFDASTGAPVSRGVPVDVVTGDRFGSSVAISGGLALVGARQTDALGSGSGSAFLFESATWIKLAEIRASDGEANAFFGRAVAIDGTTALAGAPNPTAMSPDGAAYIYDTDDLPGFWSDLGGASPGINGLPTLNAFGALTPGSILDIDLQKAAPNALLLAWLSFTSTPLNVFGGTLHANPFDVQFLRFTATGASSESLAWPAGIPAGIDMHLQYLINDVSVPAQITLSNAVMATTP